jgi:hypothetical protein
VEFGKYSYRRMKTSDASSGSSELFAPWKHGPTLLALFAALVLRPVVYTTVDPISIVGSSVSPDGRQAWWLLHCWILLLQWIPFFLAWWALARADRCWSDYGLDWSWFRRRKKPLIVCVVLLGIAAVAAPWWWYHGNPPKLSRTFALLPVTPMERLFFLLAAASAGVCEETCYRGLPLRGFPSTVIGAIWMLPVMVVPFVFVHGWFGLNHFGSYSLIGLAFGTPFLVLRRRRLEWLIVVHASIDAVCILAP